MPDADVPARFEIPAADRARAQAFHEALFDARLTRERFRRRRAGRVSLRRQARRVRCAGGASADGAFDDRHHGASLDQSVSAVLERPPGQGGKVPVPRTGLHDGPGVLARFRDSEGSRVGPCSPR